MGGNLIYIRGAFSYNTMSTGRIVHVVRTFNLCFTMVRLMS